MTPIQIIEQEFNSLKQRIADNLDETGTTASGQTKESLDVKTFVDGCILYGRKAFATVETGRKEGSIPFDFVEIIRRWAISKGIRPDPIQYIRQESERWRPKYTPEERGMNAFAGSVAYTIRERGTQLHRNNGRNDIFSNEIQKTVEIIKSRLTELYKQLAIEKLQGGTL